MSTPAPHPRKLSRSTRSAGWLPRAWSTPVVAPTPTETPRRKDWRDKEGFYELLTQPHTSTTRQAEVLNLALASRPTTHRRTIVGRDVVTGQVVGYDPFDAYNDPEDDSSNITVGVLGDVGRGKSGLLKTVFGTRQQLRGRYVVAIDKKRQGVEGEYAPLARRLGTEPIRFIVGSGGSRINLLDPQIGVRPDQTGTDADGMPTGQMRLIRAVLASAMGRKLSEVEGKAVRVGLLTAHTVAKTEGRVPVVADLVAAMLHPREADCSSIGITPATLREWGFEAAFALERMVEEDLAGLVDGPTSEEVRVDHPSRLTVFDISALPTSGPALKVVMLLIQVWMTNLLADRSARHQQTVNIVEEGWHVTDDPEIGQIFKENMKLQRGLGMSTVTGFHHPSDTPVDSPARALLQEAGSLFIFGQRRPSDVAQTLEIADLDSSFAHRLGNLPQGQCLLVRPGHDPIWLRLVRSDFEKEITNTDAQIAGLATDPLTTILQGR